MRLLHGMTMFASAFIYWRLNVSPENVDNNQKMLLGFVPSAERDELKKALDIEAERIKKGGITTRFDTKEIRVMDAPGVVEFSGTLKSSTTNGTITIPLKDLEKTYRLKIRYIDGLVTLHQFEELLCYWQRDFLPAAFGPLPPPQPFRLRTTPPLMSRSATPTRRRLL